MLGGSNLPSALSEMVGHILGGKMNIRTWTCVSILLLAQRIVVDSVMFVERAQEGFKCINSAEEFLILFLQVVGGAWSIAFLSMFKDALLLF